MTTDTPQDVPSAYVPDDTTDQAGFVTTVGALRGVHDLDQWEWLDARGAWHVIGNGPDTRDDSWPLRVRRVAPPTIDTLQALVDERLAQIQTLTEQLAAADATTAGLQNTIAEHNETIGRMTLQLSDQDRLRLDRETALADVASLREQLADAEQRIATVVTHRDQLFQDLAQATQAQTELRTATPCPDGGTCHHDCDRWCYRVQSCGPLSGVYPNDEWPAGVASAHRVPDTPHDHDAMLGHLVDEWGALGVIRLVWDRMDYRNRRQAVGQLLFPRQYPATEPLFTGKVLRYAIGPVRSVVEVEGPDQGLLGNLAVRIGTDVDIVPHGVRPAAPTVTAEMVREACQHKSDGRPAGAQIADALNRLLAERGGVPDSDHDPTTP